MIPNVRGSVTDYGNEKCVYAGRCLGPINRPWPVPGLSISLMGKPSIGKLPAVKNNTSVEYILLYGYI